LAEDAGHAVLGVGLGVLKDAGLHAVQRRADALNAHGLLGQLDALLCVAGQGEGQIADADVGLDALGLGRGRRNYPAAFHHPGIGPPASGTPDPQSAALAASDEDRAREELKFGAEVRS